MRPIDADELQKSLNDYVFNDPTCPMHIAATVDQYIDFAPTVCDWIPCSERKPKVMMDVLLQFEENMCVGFYSQGYWNVNSGNGFYTAVLPSEDQPIAWMPLPEPPGGDGNA